MATLDLVSLVKEEFGNEVSDKDAKYMLDGVINAIKKGLKSEGTVKLHKFGIFSIKDRSARVGRNPRTGDSVKIPASITIKFKSSPLLKDEFSVKKPVKAVKAKEVVVEKKVAKGTTKTTASAKKVAAPAPKTTKKGKVTEKSA